MEKDGKKSRGVLCEGACVKYAFIHHRRIWPAQELCRILGQAAITPGAKAAHARQASAAACGRAPGVSQTAAPTATQGSIVGARYLSPEALRPQWCAHNFER